MPAGRSADSGPTWAKPQVRAKVLQAAMEVIAEVGPDRVRVKDIADRAGMSTGHVLYYFGRRDQILVDTLLLGEADLAVRRDRRLAGATDHWQAVDVLVRMYLPGGHADVRWKLWAQLIARPPTDRETLRRFAEVIQSWASALEAVLEAGSAAGAFRVANAADTAYRTCRTMDGYSMEILLGAPGHTRTWAIASVIDSMRHELG